MFQSAPRPPVQKRCALCKEEKDENTDFYLTKGLRAMRRCKECMHGIMAEPRYSWMKRHRLPVYKARQDILNQLNEEGMGGRVGPRSSIPLDTFLNHELREIPEILPDLPLVEQARYEKEKKEKLNGNLRMVQEARTTEGPLGQPSWNRSSIRKPHPSRKPE